MTWRSLRLANTAARALQAGPRRHRPCRRLTCERLETRSLLAADVMDGLASALESIDFLPADELIFEESNVAADSAVLELLDEEQPLEEPPLDEGPPAPRHNLISAPDVDVSGHITALDALLVVNHLLYGDPSVSSAAEESAPGVFCTDVNADGQVTAADVDAVIAAIERSGLRSETEAEGESLALMALPSALAPLPPAIPAGDASEEFITMAEVETLLARAAGATSSQDAIIVIVDRGGRILGVRMEAGVLSNIPDEATRIFAIDGAVAKARTAAYFASNEAPLTSRTIRSLSQSTIPERLVESNPNIPDPTDPGQDPFNPANPISRTFGPGTVAPIGIGGHFPPDVRHTPPVDLFNIELQSRDGLQRPGADGIKGTPDDFTLENRFNVPSAFLPQGDIPAPESYGVQSGRNTNAQGRGLATLPGGIPLFKDVDGPGPGLPILVGGIGVFFPGLDGYATHEQGFIANARQTSTQRLNARKAIEAEYIAIAAAGGVSVRPVGNIGGLPRLQNYVLPFGRIDLVGIQLEVFGPNPTAGNRQPGIDTVMQRGRALGQGSITSGENQIVAPGQMYLDGLSVPEGWIVAPHDSAIDNITAADVMRIVENSRAEARVTRAAIRLDITKGTPGPDVRTKMVIAVADTGGNILGLFRMPDATVFSIDVAVAKARNVAYYADPAALQNADKVDDDLLVARGAITVAKLNALKYKNNGGALGTPDLFTNNQSTRRYNPLTGLAFTNRTFRFLAEPRYPSGVDGSLPPVFSILTDPGINRKTAENFNQAQPTPASRFTSVVGFDAFHASRNFRDPGDAGIIAAGVNPHPLANQNGIVFFPGSTPLYKSQILVGGFGVSGDGVDQDDVVTFAGQQGFAPPQNLRADMVFYRGVRLPFQKFNRNPRG